MSELTRLPARTLLREMEAGALSAVELVRAHIQRIEERDGELRAFLRLNPRAEADAAAADARRRAGRAGPLNGLPVAIKDNLDTAGIETCCASRILEGFVPLRDATAVHRLKEAGAVVLGKTNLDEFGMGSSTENSAYGPSRNPWDPSRVPGGSSGGSAVAVAAGFAPLALGSDTGGSIRQPAAFCGVVGLKPTYGRVSRLGLVAYASSLDQVGPFARNVADVALCLGALAGPDPEDATCSRRPPDDYLAAAEQGVDGLRIGLPAEYFDGLDPEVRDRISEAAEALARQGANIEQVSLPHTRFGVSAYYLVATAEASSNLARYDGIRYGRREHADNLPATYRRTRRAGFGDEVQRRIMLGTFALSAGYQDEFYGTAQRARALVLGDFLALFRAGLDAILAPVAPTTAFRLGEKVDDPLAMYLTDAFTVPASLAGIPGLAVPVGRDRAGLPVGAQILAAHFQESVLLRAGAALEREQVDAGAGLP